MTNMTHIFVEKLVARHYEMIFSYDMARKFQFTKIKKIEFSRYISKKMF